MKEKTLKDLAEFALNNLPKSVGGKSGVDGTMLYILLRKKYPDVDPKSKMMKYLVARRLAKLLPPYNHLIPKIDKLIEKENNGS